MEYPRSHNNNYVKWQTRENAATILILGRIIVGVNNTNITGKNCSCNGTKRKISLVLINLPWFQDARSRSMKTVSHHRVSVVLKQWLPSFPSRSRSPAKSNENSDIETSKVLTFKDVGQIQEYLEVLHLAMSFDDDIGSMLFDGIGLDKFKDIIMEHDRWPGSVVVESLACLWQLCFIPRALEQMKTENDLLAHIQRLQCECRSDMCTANEIKEIKFVRF